MGKPTSQPPPVIYRDEPDRDDAASTSSAVSMDTMGYPEADLPAYEDVVNYRADRQDQDAAAEPQT